MIRTLLFGLAVATVGQFPVFAEREPPIRTGLWVMQPLPENGRELNAFEAGVRADLAKWRALGNYEEKLLEVYKKYTDEWGEAFPRQEISLNLAKVLDLPPQFRERIIDYGLSKYGSRFTIQNCQLSGRWEDTGLMSYDLIQRYRDRAHHGFQSLARLTYPNERMGSIEMAVLNVVHAEGEYWELWHADGMNVETSTAVARAWEEARRIGYGAYKKKLMSEGKYRERL